MPPTVPACWSKIETRQIGLLEQTEEAALRQKKCPKLSPRTSKSLAEEMEDFRKELSGGESGRPRKLLPLLGRLEAVGEGHEPRRRMPCGKANRRRP